MHRTLCHGDPRVGGGTRKDWQGGSAVGVFDAKADLGAALDALGHDIDKLQLVAEAPAWSHPEPWWPPARSGPTNIIGWFGELHPGLGSRNGHHRSRVAAFELDLDAIPEPRKKTGKSKGALKLSDLMPLERDFAFLVDRDVSAAVLLRAARNADKALITDAGIFDLFEGKGVEPGKEVGTPSASRCSPPPKTLTDEEIEKIGAAVVAAVGKATGGVLRS